MVAKRGREFYAEGSEVDWPKASQWTLQVMRPQFEGSKIVRKEIGYAIRWFIYEDKNPVFWGYLLAYDRVVFR